MRPLGSAQRDFLDALREHGGWHVGCGWTWDYPALTQRLLRSLMKRGLVRGRQEKIDGRLVMRYEATNGGDA